MGTIVYQVNPKNGAKYAYESISYWDKDKKAPRSKRKYLGRVDPETGEIIKGRQSTGKEKPADSLMEEKLREKDAAIAGLRAELEEMTAKYREAEEILKKISSLAGGR